MASSAATPLQGARIESLRRIAGGWPLLAILIGPPLVVLLLRLPLINQLNYADPWFYTGYAWMPKHEFEIFGWNYFSVRFPAIIATGLFERVFGVQIGYVVLRYLLAAAGALAIYLCARRYSSRFIALAAALLLYAQPFYTRMLLWDYSNYMAVGAGVIAVATWYWSENKRLRWTFLPGVAGAAAVFAHAESVFILILLFCIELVAAARGGRANLTRLGLRIVICVCSAALVFLLGYLTYLEILGHLTPAELIRPTLEFIGESNTQSAQYQSSVSSWILREPRIWMPVVISVALIARLGRSLLGRSVQARIAQLCIGVTALFWAYRFAVVSSMIETWWSYSFVAIPIAPAVSVLFSGPPEDGPAGGKRVIWAALGVAGFAVVALIVRNVSAGSEHFYQTFSSNRGLVAVLLALGVASAVAAGVARGRAFRLMSVCVLFALLAFMSYAPSVLDSRGGTGIFAKNATREWNSYRGGDEFADLLRNYDSPAHRVYLWYPGTLGYTSISWLDLPQFGDTLNELGVPETLTRLTPLAEARIREPRVDYVMMLAPTGREIGRGHAALASKGFLRRVVMRGSFADHHLQYELVES